MSRKKLTLFVMGLGVIVWKSSHDHGYTCRVLEMSYLNLNEIALSIT